MTLLINDNVVVTIHYTLKDDDGNVIDSSAGADPLVYLHGAKNIVPGLEDALTGKTVGDSVNVSVPPEQGYGPRVPEMVQKVPRSVFEGVDDIQPGMQFQAQSENGVQVIHVIAVEGDDITVDANHPMAGKTLHFEVTIEATRDATKEELEQGHAR